ncbi:hypothetical protein AB7M74_001801 [Bradyrhizobium japonicum]|uniref:hypothetical protein n=1 Tax=Bradyrhizobium sp. th-b2 TaxID=172088 RepID=UPI00048CDE9F|nr:hypothetical protein [Bradyrhizobium sp. th.b2]
MTGRQHLWSQLEALRAAQSAAAAKKLLLNAPVDEELKRIEQVEKLLKFIPQSNKATIYTACAVGAICLIVACVLWTTRLPTSHLQLDVTSESITIRLAKQTSWNGNWDLGGGLLRLEDMSRIEIPPELADENMLAGRSWFEGSNGDFALRSLEIQAQSELLVKKAELQTLNINSWNSPLLGQLQVYGTPKIQAGRSPEKGEKLSETRFDIPGTITFFHDASQAPAILRVTPRGSLTLADLAVEKISFAREKADSETSFQSGIIKGNLTILSIGEKPLPLEAGSRLRLEGVKGVISALTIGGDGVRLVFEGRVRSATIGPPGFERELKPSLLEYMYDQQRLGFFWAVASFLWGLLWSARTLIFR